MFVDGWRTSASLPAFGEAYPSKVTEEDGDTGVVRGRSSPAPAPQSPDLGIPVSDDCHEPSPDNWPIDDLDDWPFDDPSVDVARLRESLRESEADIAAGRTFGEDEIRARYGLPRQSAN